MNVTLFGKRGFVDTVKLRLLRSSRIILVGPKSNYKCSYKRQPGPLSPSEMAHTLWTVFPLSKPLSYLSKKERKPVEDAWTREGHVKSEAQIAVMQPQTKECLELPEAERGL